MQRGMAPKATSEPLLCRPCCCPPGTDLAAATAAGARPWTPRCPWCVGELGAAAAALLGWAARCPLASDSKAHVGTSDRILVTCLHSSCKGGWENLCHPPRPVGWEIPQTQRVFRDAGDPGGSKRAHGIPPWASHA